MGGRERERGDMGGGERGEMGERERERETEIYLIEGRKFLAWEKLNIMF